MRRLHIYFFRGLIGILPVALTVYLLYLFLTWSESLAVSILKPFVDDFYFPGLGLIIGVLIILAIGVLLSQHSVRLIFQLIERPFTNVPVVKSIYSSVKSFADYFTPSTGQSRQQVVILRHPDLPIEIVGMVTRKSFNDLPPGFLPGERVAVYLPMSYMVGGYTVFVPAEWVQPIEMSVEEAMRSSLIAWMAAEADPHQSDTPLEDLVEAVVATTAKAASMATQAADTASSEAERAEKAAEQAAEEAADAAEAAQRAEEATRQNMSSQP